ncbi:MAG: hypothetical protein VCC00_13525 [Deltaproteobacteria bacterium]
MPGTTRQATIFEVLDLAIELERRTMELYAGFMRAFADTPELADFWFGMARHEAGHCGALSLVECLLRDEPSTLTKKRVSFDSRTVVRLRGLLAGYRRELKRGITPQRAFEMAIDLEASELEDVVVDLLDVVPDAGRRSQAARMLTHDLGDLSYMIEKHTNDDALLARADALFERRRAMPRPASAPAPSGH